MSNKLAERTNSNCYFYLLLENGRKNLSLTVSIKDVQRMYNGSLTRRKIINILLLDNSRLMKNPLDEVNKDYLTFDQIIVARTNDAAVASVLPEPSDTSGKHSRLSYSSSRAQKLATLAQASEKPSFPHERNELRETLLLKRGRNWDFIDIRKKNNGPTKAAMVTWAY